MIRPADRIAQVEEYYFSKKLKEIRQLIAEGKPVINLGIGSPDQQPDPGVLAKLETKIWDESNHGYQPYQGIPELISSIKGFYQNRFHIDTKELSILPLMGSKEGIAHLSMAYLNPGDHVLIPALSYPTYTSVTKMVGGEPVLFPLLESKKWEPDWEFLEKVDTTKIKMLWINYPHMPTGAIATKETLKRYIDFAKKHDILLCHDNPYSFVLNEEPISIFSIDGAGEVAIELNSLSKTFNMAGWRIGWMMGRNELIQPALQIKSNMDSGMFKPMQLAAAKALSLGESWYKHLNAEYLQRRTLVYQILKKLGCEFDEDQSGMFVWSKANNESGLELSDRLLAEKSVFITPGFIFGEAGKLYVRISLCTNQEQLKEVLTRLS